MSTHTPPQAPSSQPRLGPRGWARWAWRQITSMRTALFLLLLIAVAAIPGSMLPQRTTNAVAVTQWINQRPTIGAIFDTVGLFDVFISPWFSAIYLLLVLSLIGCIIPRIGAHIKALRSLPPRTPRNLNRLPAYSSFTTTASEEDILHTARAMLGKARFRMRPAGEDRSIAAERGHLRETGNIAFHLGLVVVIVALAIGYLVGWKADRIVPVGTGFVNDVSSYDTFAPGPWVNPNTLDPWQLRIDSLHVKFQDRPDAPQFGQARDFSAQTTITMPDGTTSKKTLAVNAPLQFGDAWTYLLGNGYAPTITVRNPDGEVLYRQSTPFLPQDGVYTSTGAVKVVGAQPKQLGFTGVLLPSAFTDKNGPVSVYPDLENPLLALDVYTGDLYSGGPQSVYSLDTTRMTKVKNADGKPAQLWLRPGDTVQLPNNLGSVTLEQDIPRWAGLSTRYDPGKTLALVSSLVALIGLMVSLTVRRRRVYIRVTTDTTDNGSTHNTVHVGGLARGEDPLLNDAITELAHRLCAAVEAKETTTTNGHPNTPRQA
ncbi:cytochrome c biogenesis protein ResB [Dermatophilus congolensis]|uniref:cytochrome c biogenesis protein ResB n=1 Tax=Dermatophilus congolensis TaxID=1863 RepID=UPI001AAF9529|nr:cytochrome c biogenesis protein ResB [Dermatophilus congolensis]MBO3128462.1 cytochrome c biogenesis protein ResB [Dermatophilus congolensis]MBO3132899.1 cytochrome c biogenesis protein ResB [Dermatophilus congolensis]MBO3132942.1 cytochrome c biogenesis protein ResB [Dermatophilus congolensis]MBO3135179.1 cytochrome c biogenesis protein ResB [Dermatophilus congolensis]MBO3137417.1 cytochrome c biogenesis protein ResB [Dermatophilus congolensis]